MPADRQRTRSRRYPIAQQVASNSRSEPPCTRGSTKLRGDRMRALLLAIGAIVASGLIRPVYAGNEAANPYAGQQARAIKALSEADVAALRGGEGMGLAKAAELNGYPGPRHV